MNICIPKPCKIQAFEFEPDNMPNGWTSEYRYTRDGISWYTAVHNNGQQLSANPGDVIFQVTPWNYRPNTFDYEEEFLPSNTQYWQAWPADKFYESYELINQ